ncbi:nucleoside 2-deoxyribosyltransferase [uncultured Tateyamaria sp.]|uniref:nucleoside 2-deoxyribosyltransferase n=1 Tax=uncultured Tateyamaria sp. TaxID=455651 RepID=UPI0026124CC1|nr:nucleoside 2-deoxyribosyltransferase [uncultured Tateyamaria sp.]
MSTVKPFAFVLMPFSHEFDDIYKFGIKKLAESFDVVAERVDEQHFSESILERVYRQIENSDFVIAEMTGKNPNVFYEVGYAHAKGKLCALVTQSATDIPFDLKHHTHVIYDGSIADLTEKLGPKIEWLKAETLRRREQRIQVSHSSDPGFLEKSEFRHSGSMDLEVTLRNESKHRSPEIEAYYFVTTRHWNLSVDGKDCPQDDFEGQNGLELRKHLIRPDINRLSPDAFTQIKTKFSREFWTKWSGDEEKRTYQSKGIVTLEVVTSEGTLTYELPVQTTFDEIPF